MRYTWQTIKYVLKNFIFLSPFVILPAFLFALSLDEAAMELVMTSFFIGEFATIDFGEIFRMVSFLGFSSGWTIFSGLGGLVALIVGVSLMMAYIERNMRIGRRGYQGVFSKLNDNIMATTLVGVLLLVCYELFALILSAMFYLACQFTNPVITYLVATIAFLGMHFVLLYVITLGYLWLPCMHITGFHTFEALQYSNQLCQPIKWKILVDQFVLLLISEIFISLSVFIPLDNVVPTLVATLCYALMIMIFCVRMQVVYFDRAQIERADLTPYYN